MAQRSSASASDPARLGPVVSRRTALLGAAALGGVTAVASALAPYSAAQTSVFHVGRGIADMTGEPLGAGMSGYASLEQTTTGIHVRQRARTFIFASGATGPRVVLVTCEVGLIFQSIQQEVLRQLRERFGDLYHEGNVLITATHTHSAAGGDSGHALVDITALGFRPRTFAANVAGIVDSIAMAHTDLAPTEVGISQSDLYNASVNRSHTGFERAPAAERAQFPGQIDPRSQTLQMYRGGTLVGVLNWFACHATSLTKHVTLNSADNKGWAAFHWEHDVAGQDYLAPGIPQLITAFAQSNAGDLSPNLDLHPGTGPTNDEWLNTRIIGERELDAARSQIGDMRPLGTVVDVRHKWVDMSAVDVLPAFTGDGAPHRTAVAALGAAFAAGSQEDGGGGDGLPFNEGERGGNPMVAQLDQLVIPQWLRDAHGAKDILLPVGLVPGLIQRVYPFHLVRIGEHYIFGLGFEVTIISGLRLRRTIAQVLGIREDQVTVQGYTNAYGHYLTSPEEYSAQNYEAGATAFGPWQLPAIMQIASELATSMRDGTPLDPGTSERDLTGLIPPSPLGNPAVDIPMPPHQFGDVIVQPQPHYAPGQRVLTRFVGANPNTDLRRGGTYLTVDRAEQGAWVRVGDDSSWSTTIAFENLAAWTNVLITWDIPADITPGEYRITYEATGQGVGSTFPVRGETRSFQVG